MKGDKYKVAASQHKDRVQLALLDRRIEDLQNLCSLLEKSGDKKSADKNVVPKLNEAIMLDTEQQHALALEIGDVLWYCATLARDIGMTLEEVAELDIAKLNSRKQRGKLGGNGDNR